MMPTAVALHQQNTEVDRNQVILFNWEVIPYALSTNYRGFKLTNDKEYDLGSILQYPSAVNRMLLKLFKMFLIIIIKINDFKN